jgi:hypothetical protein
MQRDHALELYRQRFPGCEIVEVDTEGEEESVARIFDWVGVDKMIRKSNGTTILLSQRIRRKSVGCDFSLTYSRPDNNNPVEFDRLELSKDEPYAMMPKLYGFGVADDVIGGEAKDEYAYEQGFQSFYLIKISELVEHINAGRIDYFVPQGTSNGNGNRAAYISPEVLEKVGVVDRSWRFDGGNSQTGLDAFGDD